MTGERVAARRRLTSPWRWLGFACGAVFVVIGLSVVAESRDAPSVLIGLGSAALGIVMVVRSLRAAVLLSAEGLTDRAVDGTVRIPWERVEDVTLGEGGGAFLDYVAPLVHVRDGEDVMLTGLAGYPWVGRRRVDQQIRKIQAAWESATERRDVDEAAPGVGGLPVG